MTKITAEMAAETNNKTCMCVCVCVCENQRWSHWYQMVMILNTDLEKLMARKETFLFWTKPQGNKSSYICISTDKKILSEK